MDKSLTPHRSVAEVDCTAPRSLGARAPARPAVHAARISARNGSTLSPRRPPQSSSTAAQSAAAAPEGCQHSPPEGTLVLTPPYFRETLVRTSG